MDEGADNPFWTFSLTLYVREGVAGACLDLQDRLDLDVNLLLYCCWAGNRGRALSEAEIAGLIAATRDWRDRVVRPLRGARRWLKGRAPALGKAAEGLREDIKAKELAAEEVEQAILQRALAVPPGAPEPNIMAGNLRAYLKAEGHQPVTETVDDLARLLLAAAPTLEPAHARRLLAGDPSA